MVFRERMRKEGLRRWGAYLVGSSGLGLKSFVFDSCSGIVSAIAVGMTVEVMKEMQREEHRIRILFAVGAYHNFVCECGY